MSILMDLCAVMRGSKTGLETRIHQNKLLISWTLMETHVTMQITLDQVSVSLSSTLLKDYSLICTLTFIGRQISGIIFIAFV